MTDKTPESINLKQEGSDDLDQFIEDMKHSTTRDKLQKNVIKHIRNNPKLRDKLINRIDRLYMKKIPDTHDNRRKLKLILWRMYYRPILLAKGDFWDSCARSAQIGVAVSKNSHDIEFPTDKVVDDIMTNGGA